ncbi:MAG TPA: hypothetical protein VGO00_01370, partial [Kofleriaceae bacterium]|nr:hypothetical protein [Kofleriaceae bacterium]
MTTGVPIYLVSACSSPEEFVAAFRRYIDRSGVFVPIVEPFSVGRRARLALTLIDGGVMIEGDAEVVAAATKPSALHGRIGMTIRFIEADAPSKLVIAEIEKARLVMKPPSSAVAPRPAILPEGPRPVPPPVGGRVDAANALAECVARGDVKPAVPAPIVESASGSVSKSGPKFVMPAIPGAPDSKATTLGVAPLSKPTTLGVAPLERPKGISGPIPMIGRRDPRLPLTPRVVPNAAGTPPLAVPNVSSRAGRSTSEPPKSDEPAPEVSRTSTDPDLEPSVVVVHSPVPVEAEGPAPIS